MNLTPVDQFLIRVGVFHFSHIVYSPGSFFFPFKHITAYNDNQLNIFNDKLVADLQTDPVVRVSCNHFSYSYFYTSYLRFPANVFLHDQWLSVALWYFIIPIIINRILFRVINCLLKLNHEFKNTTHFNSLQILLFDPIISKYS